MVAGRAVTRTIGVSGVDVAVRVVADIGEGPTWDDRAGELLWVDIPRGLVHRLHGGAISTIEVGQPVGAVALRRSGGLVLAVRDGFALWEEGAATLVAPVERNRPASRMNDGKVDRAGRFWAGTMSQSMQPSVGALYRLDGDLDVVRMLEGLDVPNGIAWSPDDRTMYFIDSLSGRVDAFDHDAGTGRITARRPVVTVPRELGMPDGMTIDGVGHLWVAIWGGSCVRRYAPDGALDTVIELPTRHITSCVLAGPRLNELYVTSASADLSPDERRAEPEAGMVFHVEVDVPGLPPERFAG